MCDIFRLNAPTSESSKRPFFRRYHEIPLARPIFPIRVQKAGIVVHPGVDQDDSAVSANQSHRVDERLPPVEPNHMINARSQQLQTSDLQDLNAISALWHERPFRCGLR